jgi:hypothetical protein
MYSTNRKSGQRNSPLHVIGLIAAKTSTQFKQKSSMHIARGWGLCKTLFPEVWGNMTKLKN